MTTICWDGKTFASDRQSTYGSTPVPTTKIHKLKYRGEDAYLACSGAIMDFAPIVEWIKSGKKAEPEIDGDKSDFSIMIVTKSGDVFYAINGTFFHELGKVKWAIGSGCDYALGAMYHGATAAEAIEIAARLDVHTGHGVDARTFKGKQ